MEMTKRSKWALVGIPDHLGVENIGGRVGAALGPKFFRKSFFKMSGAKPWLELMEDLGDCGPIASDIEANHKTAIELVQKAHSKFDRTIIIGGGHDHGFTHLVGIKNTLAKNSKLGCINIDAHLDVRKPEPTILSGSPFYLAIESKTIEPDNLIEFGIQGHCNAPSLWEYVESKGIEVVDWDAAAGSQCVSLFEQSLKKLAKRTDAIAISLDLDAVIESSAPGVSAPQADGITPTELMKMMRICHEEPKVVSLGIFELNPFHDQDSKTSRLAATAAFNFISGCS